MGRPVEILESRVLHVRGELAAAVHEPPVLGAVRGNPQHHAALAHRSGQLAHHVSAGPHLRGVPPGEAAGVHGEAVVVLGDGHDVLRSGLQEQVRPLVGIEPLRPEHRDEVLVSKTVLRAVRADVVLELGGSAHVHVARVPLVAEGGHAVHAPVDEDPELGIQIPLGDDVVLQAVPRWAIGSGRVRQDHGRTLPSGHRPSHAHSATFKTLRNASCGSSTEPICFIRFLPSFCFSRSLRLRVTSPP